MGARWAGFTNGVHRLWRIVSTSRWPGPGSSIGSGGATRLFGLARGLLSLEQTASGFCDGNRLMPAAPAINAGAELSTWTCSQQPGLLTYLEYVAWRLRQRSRQFSFAGRRRGVPPQSVSDPRRPTNLGAPTARSVASHPPRVPEARWSWWRPHWGLISNGSAWPAQIRLRGEGAMLAWARLKPDAKAADAIPAWSTSTVIGTSPGPPR